MPTLYLPTGGPAQRFRLSPPAITRGSARMEAMLHPSGKAVGGYACTLRRQATWEVLGCDLVWGGEDASVLAALLGEGREEEQVGELCHRAALAARLRAQGLGQRARRTAVLAVAQLHVAALREAHHLPAPRA